MSTLPNHHHRRPRPLGASDPPNHIKQHTDTPQPKPLEPLVADIRNDVSRIHPDVEAYLSVARNPAHDAEDAEARRQSLITALRTIATAVELVEAEREDWWKGKAGVRKACQEEGREETLRQLNLVNNKVVAMIRDMEARVGMFARWGLDVKDWGDRNDGEES